MTNANQLEGTLTAVKNAVAAITPKDAADATLLAMAQSAISTQIDTLTTANKTNGCIVSLAVDGTNFRCAFSVTPRAILV
jgi:hypothetical protein